MSVADSETLSANDGVSWWSLAWDSGSDIAGAVACVDGRRAQKVLHDEFKYGLAIVSHRKRKKIVNIITTLRKTLQSQPACAQRIWLVIGKTLLLQTNSLPINSNMVCINFGCMFIRTAILQPLRQMAVYCCTADSSLWTCHIRSVSQARLATS